jgi:hypothetical protein
MAEGKHAPPTQSADELVEAAGSRDCGKQCAERTRDRQRHHPDRRGDADDADDADDEKSACGQDRFMRVNSTICRERPAAFR